MPVTWNREKFNGRSEAVAKWFDLRWSISRFAHFSKATFFNEHSGPVTPFELGFITLAAVVSIILVIVSDKTASGQITQYMVFISVLIALKINALQLILGVSWERAILMHKSIAVVSLACACIHGIPQLSSSGSAILADGKQYSGLIMILLMGLQPIMYVIMKPWNFEVFYYFHLAVYVVLVVFAFIHGALFVLYSIIIFAVDLLIRYLLNSRRVKFTAERKAGNVVQVTFEKRWDYRPGQFVFVMIPALGVHEWHPFSISSAPHELLVSLHIDVDGDWTQRLANLLAKESNTGPVELNAFVEGPYGLFSVNFEDSTYQIVLLISGSIGVTPNQSLANDLLEARACGRPLKKIVYVWALKENKLGLIDTMRESGQLPGITDITTAGADAGAHDKIGAKQDNNEHANETEVKDLTFGKIVPGERVLELEVYCTGAAASGNVKKISVTPQSVSSELELTSLEAPVLTTEANEALVMHQGRPNLVAIFQRVKELAVLHNERRVAVSVCGPATLVQTAAAACREITGSEVQFDIHIEKFNL